MNVNQQRLVSLDAMRGFVMFLLLGGGEIGHAGFLSALFAAIDNPWAQTLYHQLQYSGWSDATHVKDLIRPLFIFVVGVAMPYSLPSHSSDCPFTSRQGSRNLCQLRGFETVSNPR